MNPIELNFTVDLAKKETQVVRDLNSPLYYGDMNAHTLNITILRNGEPEDLSDVTPYGYIVFESTGDTVELADSSSKSGNVVSVTLSDEAYAVTGRAYIVVQLAKTGARATVFAVYCWIGLGVTDSIIVPSGSRLDIDALTSKIAEFEQKISEVQDLVDDMEGAVASVNDAVKYGSQTGKTEAEKAQARENIGAQERIEPDGAVALDLTDSVAAYPTGNVGQQIGYNNSSATTTYKHAAWVQEGCEYALTIVNGETLAADTNRASMVIDADGTILQTMSTAVLASTTVTERFTAVADGFLVFSVDANAVSLSMIGGPLYGVVKYNTAQTLSASQQKTARGNIGAADEADERGRDGLITYRTEAFDLAEVPGATNATCIGAESTGEIVTLNGTNNASGGVYVRLTGPGTRTASATTVRGWTGALTIPSGTVCRLTMRLLSGSVDGAVAVSVYKSGTSSTIGNARGSNGLYERTWVSDGESVSVVVWIASGATLTDAVYSIIIEDITHGQFGLSVAVDGTTPTITAAPGIRYECGTVNELTFTPSSSGLCEVVFTSGSTATVLTLPSTVRMPDWWTGVESNRTYDLMVLNGTLGAVMSWAT